MTDELLYTKLATAIATTHSPLPELHGVRVDVLNQLYPILITPLFGSLDVPTAFHAAHILNAALMASAAAPAYLLAREVVSRTWSLGVALVSVLLPWMVLTGVLMTEAAAYPAFLWALLSLQRAIVAPSRRRDLLAAGGLLLAVLARTQFVLLVAVLPLAVLGIELGASGGVMSGPRRERLREAAVTAYRRHRELAGLYALGATVVGVVAALGSLGRLLGSYAVTAHGSPLPAEVWSAAAAHLDAIAIGTGVVPLVLGGGWILATAVQPRDRRAHGLALLSLLTIVALTFETASYDLRFGGEKIVRDRYLFYAVPLLLVGTTAAIDGARRRTVALGAAVLTVFFAATVHLLDFPTTIAFWVDAPTRALNDTLARQAGSLGVAGFVALAGLCLGVAAVAGLLFLPRLAFGAAVFAFLLPFAALSTRHEIDRVVATKGSSTRPLASPSGLVLDWVDKTLPTNTSAAMVPFPQSTEFANSAVLWWDVEFWNKAVVRTYVAKDGHFTYAPFPDRKLEPDWSTGRVVGTADAPPFVIAAENDPRVGLAGVPHAKNLGLTVLLVDRPYRAVWMTRGLDTDGWALAGKPARIRVFSRRDLAEVVRLELVVGAPPAPARYVVGGRAGHVDAGQFVKERLRLCVPARSFAEVTLTSRSPAQIPKAPVAFDVTGTRRVGVRVGPIAADFTGRPCKRS